MSTDLFAEYKGVKDRDGVVAAAQVVEGQIRKLSRLTGGLAGSRTLRGGSVQLCNITLHGETAKFGDYIIALQGGFFQVVKKDIFEKTYVYKGPLRDPVV